jgi:hypothetical protein
MPTKKPPRGKVSKQSRGAGGEYMAPTAKRIRFTREDFLRVLCGASKVNATGSTDEPAHAPAPPAGSKQVVNKKDWQGDGSEDQLDDQEWASAIAGGAFEPCGQTEVRPQLILCFHMGRWDDLAQAQPKREQKRTAKEQLPR